MTQRDVRQIAAVLVQRGDTFRAEDRPNAEGGYSVYRRARMADRWDAVASMASASAARRAKQLLQKRVQDMLFQEWGIP